MEYIVITGTSSGIGKSIENTLVNKKRMIIAINRQTIEETEFIKQVKFDLNNTKEIPSLWKEIVSKGSPITALVLNAGCGNVKKIIDETYDNCYEVMNINFISPYLLAKEAAIHWTHKKNKGSIIFIGSQAGFLHNGQPNNSLYSASKAAIHSLIGSLSKELAPNIRVNAIAPGDVMTKLAIEGAKKFVKDSERYGSLEEYYANIIECSSLKRFVEASEIAQSVEYLLNNNAITGSVLNVSAGTTIY